ADPRREAIIVRGTKEQIQEIRDALIPLESDPPGAGSTRTITLDRGSAVVLAKEIQRMMKEMRPTLTVRVIAPAELALKNDSAPPKEPGKPVPTLTLTAFGNRLIVASD